MTKPAITIEQMVAALNEGYCIKGDVKWIELNIDTANAIRDLLQEMQDADLIQFSKNGKWVKVFSTKPPASGGGGSGGSAKINAACSGVGDNHRWTLVEAKNHEDQ